MLVFVYQNCIFLYHFKNKNKNPQPTYQKSPKIYQYVCSEKLVLT